MMGCLEVRRLTPRLIALELPDAAESEVRTHLRTCPACRSFVAAREPALALALKVADRPEPRDDRFVGEVLAEVRQRALERRLSGRRSRLLAAAAAVAVVLLGGTVVVRHFEAPLSLHAPVSQAKVEISRAQPQVAEPAFVEVDESGVRVYQLSPPSQSREAIQVAFIVDPHLEL
jgi:anti-sigma factor RsiW